MAFVDTRRDQPTRRCLWGGWGGTLADLSSEPLVKSTSNEQQTCEIKATIMPWHTNIAWVTSENRSRGTWLTAPVEGVCRTEARVPDVYVVIDGDRSRLSNWHPLMAHICLTKWKTNNYYDICLIFSKFIKKNRPLYQWMSEPLRK